MKYNFIISEIKWSKIYKILLCYKHHITGRQVSGKNGELL